MKLFDKDTWVLDDLMKKAEQKALRSMKEYGACRPYVMTLNYDGSSGGHFPTELRTQQSRDFFLREAKALCTLRAADAMIFAFEAWVVKTSDKKSLNPSVGPSESPGRQEAVVIVCETRGGQYKQILPIIRDGGGKFQSFGRSTLERNERVAQQGRFLTAEVPDWATRRAAAQELEAIAREQMKTEERGRGMSI